MKTTVYNSGAPLSGVSPCVIVEKTDGADEKPYALTVRDMSEAAVQMWLSADDAVKLGLALVKSAAPDFGLLGDDATIAAIKQMPADAAP